MTERLLAQYQCCSSSRPFYCLTSPGTLKEPGILPRVLDSAFHHMHGRQYDGMDLKPHLRSAVRHLDPEQVKQERSAKAAILASVKEVRVRLLLFTSGLLLVWSVVLPEHSLTSVSLGSDQGV